MPKAKTTPAVKWSVAALEYKNDVPNKPKYVNIVHWNASLQDEASGEYASTYGAQSLTVTGSADFTAYDNLTESTVLGWLFSELDKVQIEESLQTALQAKLNPISGVDTPPWNKISPAV